MTLETKEVRPHGEGSDLGDELADGPVVDDSVRRTSLAEQLELAMHLVEQLDEQRAREQAAFREGFRLAFESGVDVGRARAEREERERDEAQAEAIARTSQTWTLIDLKALKLLEAAAEKDGIQLPGGMQTLRYPGYAAEQLRVLRGRDRFPLGERLCIHCDGRGVVGGGVT